MTRLVTVQALKSFDGFVCGEVCQVMMEESTAQLVVNHYLKLLDDPAWSSHGDGADQPGVGVRPEP